MVLQYLLDKKTLLNGTEEQRTVAARRLLDSFQSLSEFSSLPSLFPLHITYVFGEAKILTYLFVLALLLFSFILG